MSCKFCLAGFFMPKRFLAKGVIYMSKTMNQTRKIAVTAILAAMSTALMFLEFPIPALIPGFIKMDFSELPALIASFSMGPLCGVTVCLVKNMVHLPFTMSGGVGELANFILSSSFVLTAGLVYKHKKTRAGAFLGSLLGAFIMAAISVPSNYFVVYPIYEKLMPMEAIIGAYQAILPSVKTLLQALLIFNTPFTFVKGMLSVVITFFIYKKISPIIKGTSKTED